jgi:hypothetical protein
MDPTSQVETPPPVICSEIKEQIIEAVKTEVRAYMEQEHECDLSGFSPEELQGIIAKFDKQEMHWGKRLMLKTLQQYGSGEQGQLHGRQDLQELAVRVLRAVDKEELDWQRHFTAHERALLREGDGLLLTRRAFLSGATGAVGVAFLGQGAIAEIAAQNDVHTSVPAAKEEEAFRRLVQQLKGQSEDWLGPKSEMLIGGILIADAWKEWNRVKKELVTEKLEQVAHAVQELYERTQQKNTDIKRGR